MSDATEEPTPEEMLAIMSNPELLSEEGYRLTPKGHMGLVLMELGVVKDVAEKVAEAMSTRIFDAGWTYLPPESLDLGLPDDL